MNIIAHKAAVTKIATTRVKFSVWGYMAGNRFQPYDEPEFRQAGPGEVVEQGGQFWQLIFNGRSFVGNRPVSDLVQEYHKSLLLEAQIRAAHGDALNRLRFGDAEPLYKANLLNRFASAGD